MADMIKDVDIEKTQLLKMTEQQKKVDKKNYLLQENISYLKKIVYNLNPSPHLQGNTTLPVLDMKS